MQSGREEREGNKQWQIKPQHAHVNVAADEITVSGSRRAERRETETDRARKTMGRIRVE